MGKREAKLRDLRKRQDQIERLLDIDARALGYVNFEHLDSVQPMLPEDFARHIDALQRESLQITEHIEQRELRHKYGRNVIVFPLSKRHEYDQSSRWVDAGGNGPDEAA